MGRFGIGGVTLNIYQIDRVQYIKSKNRLIIFEFFLVEDIGTFMHHFTQKGNKFSKEYIDENYLKKLRTLYDLANNNVYLIIIIYDKIEEKIFYMKQFNQIEFQLVLFNEFQTIFNGINNIEGEEKKSKILGSIREENTDTFVLDTLKKINSCIDENDDNGLEITKKLLGDYTTKGFDFDLFQVIETTGETIIYEFLKNETSYITNYKAHPMRYCWTGKPKDNKQKFIGLWAVKGILNGRLFLINYSDNLEDGIGISEILDLDIIEGIREEYKYNLTYQEFIDWMTEMNEYIDTDRDYLKNYNDKRKHFDADFFANWNINKKNYY